MVHYQKQKTNLYINKIPLKTLFFLEFIAGSILLFVFIHLFRSEVFLGIWVFAGPLLSLALIITGLTGSQIKEVNMLASSNSIEIIRESLFRIKTKKVEIEKMSVEIKSADGKKNSLIQKIRLIILEAEKEVEELKSDFLALNNRKIAKLYKDLKLIGSE